jgi:hypothetical protein
MRKLPTAPLRRQFLPCESPALDLFHNFTGTPRSFVILGMVLYLGVVFSLIFFFPLLFVTIFIFSSVGVTNAGLSALVDLLTDRI